MFKLLLLLLIIASPIVRAYEEITLSPVQVVDYLKFGEHFKTFDSRPELQALANFTSILYDKIINRPWEERYIPEADKRWQVVRKEFCPALKKLCALPAAITGESELEKIYAGISATEVQEEIRTEVLLSAKPMYWQNIYYLEQPPEQQGQNILLSGYEARISYPEIKLWDMKGVNLNVVEKEFNVISDLVTYLNGFSMHPSNSFVLGSDQEIVLNLDAIKAKSMEFAKIWKAQITALNSPTRNLADIDSYILSEAYERYGNRFDEVLNELTARFPKLPERLVPDLKARFASEQAAGEYPEEVFQQVTYEIFHKIFAAQARYFAVAKKERTKLNWKRKVWESLLTIQTEADPQLALYLVFVEAGFPRNVALQQFVNPNVAKAYIFEHVKAVLDDKEFAKAKGYRKFKHLLKSEDIFEAEFLQNEIPAVYQALLDPKSGNLRDFFSLSEVEQKRLWKLYLYDNGKPRTFSLYRIAGSIVSFASADDARELAKHIHSVRSQEFTQVSKH